MLHILLLLSKSAKTAMLLTSLIPGGGQFYTERYAKGAIIGGIQSYLIIDGVQTQIKLNRTPKENKQKREELSNKRRNIAWKMALVWSLGILDAYVDAQLYNFESDLTIDQTGAPKIAFSFKIKY